MRRHGTFCCMCSGKKRLAPSFRSTFEDRWATKGGGSKCMALRAAMRPSQHSTGPPKACPPAGALSSCILKLETLKEECSASQTKANGSKDVRFRRRYACRSMLLTAHGLVTGGNLLRAKSSIHFIASVHLIDSLSYLTLCDVSLDFT